MATQKVKKEIDPIKEYMNVIDSKVKELTPLFKGLTYDQIETVCEKVKIKIKVGVKLRY